MFTYMTTNEVTNDLLCDDYANWSYEAAEALADYYQDLEDQLDDMIQYDRVAIRCEWSELTKDELLADYGYLAEQNEQDGVDDWSIDQWAEFLNDHTTILELTSGNRLLVMQF